jgi:hypothetical protein
MSNNNTFLFYFLNVLIRVFYCVLRKQITELDFPCRDEVYERTWFACNSMPFLRSCNTVALLASFTSEADARGIL